MIFVPTSSVSNHQSRLATRTTRYDHAYRKQTSSKPCLPRNLVAQRLTSIFDAFVRRTKRRRNHTDVASVTSVARWNGTAAREIDLEVSALIVAMDAQAGAAVVQKQMPMRQIGVEPSRSVREITASRPWPRIYYRLSVAACRRPHAASESGSAIVIATETVKGIATTTGQPALGETTTPITTGSAGIGKRSGNGFTAAALTEVRMMISPMAMNDHQVPLVVADPTTRTTIHAGIPGSPSGHEERNRERGHLLETLRLVRRRHLPSLL
jgi:hypothetical protein